MLTGTFLSPSKYECRFLFVYGSALAEPGIQDLLAHPEALRGDFQQFIRIDELQALLQGKDPGRSQLQRFIGAGRSGIG